MARTARIQPQKPALAHEFESVALLLQGGGALGAYQIGVYEALSEQGIEPDWVAGVSIGAINGAIIAGNRPEHRLEKLRGFWQQVTSNPLWDKMSLFNPLIASAGTEMRTLRTKMSAAMSMACGTPGFFSPRLVPPWLLPEGAKGAESYYDTDALKETLEKFIDFDTLNSGTVHYSTTAVDVRTGNFVHFDTIKQKIGPEHVMASGALPPALPAVEIDGEYYWDAGLVSNTPLQTIMDDAKKDTLVFQVDLWSARGEVPGDIVEVMTREKEIQYSSRTRAMTTRFREMQEQRHNFAALYKKLPEELRNTKEARALYASSDTHVYNIVHLIYRARQYEGYSKDYEFSRLSMEKHWKAGYNDTARSLRHPEIFRRSNAADGISTFDVAGN